MHALTPFNPAPEAADELLTSLATDPHTSLADLARRHHTTLEALTLWATRPDIAARLASFDSLFAHRARLIASGLLPAAISTLSAILAEFARPAPHNPHDPHNLHHHRARHDDHAPSATGRHTPSREPNTADDRAASPLRLRAAETARRAATTLIRLANFTPGPRPAPRAGAPSRVQAAPPRATPPQARGFSHDSPVQGPQTPSVDDPAALLAILAALADAPSAPHPGAQDNGAGTPTDIRIDTSGTTRHTTLHNTPDDTNGTPAQHYPGSVGSALLTHPP